MLFDTSVFDECVWVCCITKIQFYCHKLQKYGTQWVANAECCNETVVHNVLGEMWSVCIMASIWRNNQEVIISSPRKGKVNIVFVRKS